MNKWLLLVIVLLGINLVGCSNGKPPKVSLEVGDETYETTLGTYYWGTTCVDTVGPIEIMEDKEPIHVVQVEESKEIDIVLTDNRFTAPTQKGVYYLVDG